MIAALLLLILAGAAAAERPTSEQTRAVLSRLGKEADRFERNAHRFTGRETLRQLQPAGTRFSTGPRGIVTRLPEVTHEIVSEYGFISSDEPGGSLKEVRVVLTVNGLAWKRGKKELNDLAQRIAAQEAKNRAKTLESFEDYGLRGFLSDAGQLLLLFARAGYEKYEFAFDREDSAGTSGAVWVYRYRQLDESQALTIYGGKETVRARLAGELWVRSADMLPVRLTIDSSHVVEGSQVRDFTEVSYQTTRWGLLLPARIDHRQYVDQNLFVSDQFVYSDFKETMPGKPR